MLRVTRGSLTPIGYRIKHSIREYRLWKAIFLHDICDSQ
jgi:hypothetical protein